MKKRRKKKRRSRATADNGTGNYQMKAFMVKKRMMKAIKDCKKRDICTINTKINKIEISSSLRIRCMM
jgi:hypothetical protein